MGLGMYWTAKKTNLVMAIVPVTLDALRDVLAVLVPQVVVLIVVVQVVEVVVVVAVEEVIECIGLYKVDLLNKVVGPGMNKTR